jgi:hypothetical protein
VKISIYKYVIDFMIYVISFLDYGFPVRANPTGNLVSFYPILRPQNPPLGPDGGMENPLSK